MMNKKIDIKIKLIKYINKIFSHPLLILITTHNLSVFPQFILISFFFAWFCREEEKSAHILGFRYKMLCKWQSLKINNPITDVPIYIYIIECLVCIYWYYSSSQWSVCKSRPFGSRTPMFNPNLATYQLRTPTYQQRHQ